MLESLSSLSSQSSADPVARRPGARSFSRLEATSSSPLSRNRAATLDTSVPPESHDAQGLDASSDGGTMAEATDTFEKQDEEAAEEANATADWMNRAEELPEGFDELPIELISLTDRFVESLSAKVWPHPPSIDRLSTLFQDFYVTAASHISTHISTLASRQHRQRSPVPSVSSRSSSMAKANGRAVSTSSREKVQASPDRVGPEQQMLTSSEIADRRNFRKLLETKRLVLEEAVERRACEGVYDRIWRHRTSHDEEEDEKLRSKTAALFLVGIGLEELGIGVDAQRPDGSVLGEDDVREWLAEARDELMRMNDESYPLGKLLHLKAAHKSIVDSLSRFHPSSSSADEILPTLIYTLITTPAEGINIISNSLFIQRFRTSSKIDGEAAYCLTNLEAAISFLETVDLASLRADETPTGQLRPDSRPTTPNAEGDEPLKMGKAPTESSVARDPVPSTTKPSNPDATASLKALPGTSTSPGASNRASSHQRRLSYLLQGPANPFGAAGDAVITRADQGLKTVSSTLENSYRFLFGRLQERQLNNPALEGDNPIVVPKTLDEARRLVSTPSDAPPLSAKDSEMAQKVVDMATSSVLPDNTTPRERSVDSTRSGNSAKRVNFAQETPISRDTVKSAVPKAPSGQPANPTVESMRNLGNSLNPLSRFAGINVMRPFSRTASATPPMLASPSETSRELSATGPALERALESTESASKVTLPEMSASVPEARVSRLAPPISKFMELDNPGDLKISEVMELLRDYRRLAGALKDMRAF